MNNKKYIIFFFFSVILFLRITDVHFYTHISDVENELEHCKACEVINSSDQFTPLFNSPILKYKSSCDYSNSHRLFDYKHNSLNINILHPGCIHNKPPPLS